MIDDVAGEVRRRNERASADAVHDAVRAALRDALFELAAARGSAYLDTFLARRLEIVASLRLSRPGEPPALAIARSRNADAIEAALRDIVSSMHASGTDG